MRDPTAGDAAMLVTDSIPDRLSQVRRKGVAALRLERVEPAKRAQQRVLDQIRGIGSRAGPSGKATVGPAAEVRQVPTDELPERA
jgi:hypothetical protein